MSDRFEVESIHVSSGALLDNNPPATHKDIYKLVNLQVRVYYPPQPNLLDAGPTQEELAEDLGQVVREALEKADLRMDTEVSLSERKKIKHPSPFKNGEEIAKEAEFGWYKVL